MAGKPETRISRNHLILAGVRERLMDLLLHPRRRYESDGVHQADTLVVILLLMLLTALQEVLWAAQSHVPVSAAEVIRQVFLGVLLGWGGLSSLFYFIGRLVKKTPDFTRLAVLVGAAGLPLVVTTLISVLLTTLCLLFGIEGNVESWLLVHTIIGWVGLVLGWPGWFSAMALRAGLNLKWHSALIICGVLLGFLIAGSIFPLYFQ